MSEIGKNIIRGAEEALAYAKGKTSGTTAHKIKVPSEVNVSDIRKKLHMSRQKFSEEFGFSIRTLEKWERGERLPEGPARAYLTVIDKNPSAVIDALHKAS
ncbi:MAG: helix-turn-helix domain-containing protein [Gammaproteobacteria bacterium]|nr:helix-turn-helix domain-containing protein [Gammaproteobacteria bacterium]